jgi:hypothetical protein
MLARAVFVALGACERAPPILAFLDAEQWLVSTDRQG